MDSVNLPQDLPSRFGQQNFEKLKIIETKINKVISKAQNLRKKSNKEEKLLKSKMNTYLALKHYL